MNAIMINYHNELDLRFEVLKGVKIDNTVEHSNDISSAKEMLMNVKINDRSLFVGIKPGMDKNANNTLAVMHESMLMEGKD